MIKFDYSELYNFLQQERTEGEILQHFRIEKHNAFNSILKIATFKMLIYEYKDDRGRLIYGLLRG